MRSVRGVARAIVDAGAHGAGAQLVITRHGRVLCDESFGLARPAVPMTSRTIQGLFCMTKPIVACAVCATADAHGISLDDDVRGVSPAVARLLGDRPVSLRDVLSHAAGLHPICAAEAMLMPPTARVEVFAHAKFAPDWRIGIDRSYSDFQGWNVLRVWLEDVTGISFATALRTSTLAPLGLDDCYFGVTDPQWIDVRDRLGINFQTDDGAPMPMLHGLMRKYVDDPLMQAIGGIGSANTVARFYEAVLDVLAGQARAGLPSPNRLHEMVQPVGTPATDPLCSTPVAFALGFMTELAGAFGESVGPRAFGHLGLMGNAFAFADPDLDLVTVFVSNGLLFSVDGQRRIADMRHSIVGAIYDELAVAA